MSNNILSKLAKIQKDLKAPKNKDNSFGHYKYRSCEDILEAVKPLLSANGLVLLINDEVIHIEGRFYIKATATIYDIESEAKLFCSAYAREAETKAGSDLAQLTGACSSYARKYALNALFAIDDTKDADTDENTIEATARASEAKPKATRARATATKTAEVKAEPKADDSAKDPIALARAKYQELIKYCTEKHHDIKEVAKAYGLNSKSSAEDFSTALSKLIYTDAKAKQAEAIINGSEDIGEPVEI